MKVRERVFLVHGARRAAAYNLHDNLCAPLSQEEAALLTHLSHGLDLARWPGERGRAWRVASALREKGLVCAGRPVVKSLSLPVTRDDSPSPLKHVWLELTALCNLECVHCYADSHPRVDRSTELHIEDWIEVAKKLARLSPEIVTLIGGEPTIRLDLAEPVFEVFRKFSPRTRFRVFSNLTLDKVALALKTLADRYSIEIGTSLYGTTAETHDKTTLHAGSWNRTVRAIRELVEFKVPVFVGFYYSEQDSLDRSEVAKWLQSLGLDDFEILTPSQVGRGQRMIWRNARVKNKLPASMPIRSGPLNDARHNCFADHLSVRPDGSLNPCIMMREDQIGNLLRDDLDTVAARMDQFASLGKSKIQGCSDCEFRFACFDCRPDAMTSQRDHLAKPKCGYDPMREIGDSLLE